jgi:hypothetical protein
MGGFAAAMNPGYAMWLQMYQLAYQAAAEQVRQEARSKRFWEPNLN